ncbi:hypothetical protein BD311DRAFT_615754, partial [Dichomitus squalens]
LDIDELQVTSVITNFTIPFSAILISRFLLHLQSASIGDTGSILSSRDSLTNLDGGSVIFERVVGSLGASIAPSDYLVQD